MCNNMEVSDAKLRAIGLNFGNTVKKRELLPRYRVQTVTVLSNPKAEIRRMVHLEAGQEQ